MSIKPVLDWDDAQVLSDIRVMGEHHPKLTDTEFNTFINTCRTMNLNPFTKEIYCLKNGARMQIIIARDGYRKVAQREAEYDYHQTDAVYANDKFRVIHSEVEHEYQLTDRGQIIGAYCTVKRKSSSKSMYVYVEFKEYNLKQNLWTSKPATMIKKVAEAHALRMAFQAVFAGTYDKDELPEEITDESKPKEIKSEVVPKETKFEAVMITEEQVTKIDDLMMLGDISYERITDAIKKFYKKDALSDLTAFEADNFITRLEKRVQNELSKNNDVKSVVEHTHTSADESQDTEEMGQD